MLVYRTVLIKQYIHAITLGNTLFKLKSSILVVLADNLNNFLKQSYVSIKQKKHEKNKSLKLVQNEGK